MAIVFGFCIEFGDSLARASAFADEFSKLNWLLSENVAIDFAGSCKPEPDPKNGSWNCFIQPPGLSLPSSRPGLQVLAVRVELLRRFYEYLESVTGYRFAYAGWEVFGEISVEEIIRACSAGQELPCGLVVSRELWSEAGSPPQFTSFSTYGVWRRLESERDYLEIARAFPNER